jgi:hypothetical protein
MSMTREIPDQMIGLRERDSVSRALDTTELGIGIALL